MSYATQIQVPTVPTQPQSPQADSTTTLIFAIAFLIKTSAISIAILIKATKR